MATTFDGVPLFEALKWGQDEIDRAIIEVFVENTQLLHTMPFRPVSGRVLSKTHEGTLPSANFRAVNVDIPRVHGAIDMSDWGTAILSCETQVDIAELHSGITEEGEFRAKLAVDIGKAMSLRYQWEAFNGTGDNDGFFGFNTIIDQGFGQHYQPDADAALNFDELDLAFELMDLGDASVIIGNRRMHTRLLHRARDGFTQFTLVTTGNDMVGKPIMEYRGIPWLKVLRGQDSTGAVNELLPFTETTGGGSDTTSLYLLRYDSHDGVCGLAGLGGSVSARWLPESSEGPWETLRGETYPGLASFSPYSLVRYSRITAA